MLSGSGAWETWDNRSAVNMYRVKVGMCSIQDACNLSGVYALPISLYSLFICSLVLYSICRILI